MMLLFLIISLIVTFLVSLSKNRKMTVACSSVFYLAQLVFTIYILAAQSGETVYRLFTFDNMGMVFHVLMSVIAPIVFYQSISYLDTESSRDFKIYNISLIMLCLSATGVYYANNSAVTWIFLEATTLATAGLVYHRRTVRSLEATWKYVFISSVGIAIAYLGILMISTAVTGDEGLSYSQLALSISQANPLYMKLAFLFIFTGYSCKMEVFPLYAVGVDANYVAPSPASALISTALVNAGFVAFFRIYKVISASEIYPWAQNVLVIAGIVSITVGAVYLRRTNNYKRFLSYSTVENAGIAMLGLGIGGVGVFAAVFHMLMHTLIKSGMFLHMAQIGKLYGTYRMNRIGGYLNLYRTGGIVVIMGLVCMLAMPPSGLFVSELMIIKEMVAGQRWVILVIFTLLVCLIVYTLCRRFSALALRPSDTSKLSTDQIDRPGTWLHLALFIAAMVFGIVQPGFLVEFINSIIM